MADRQRPLRPRGGAPGGRRKRRVVIDTQAARPRPDARQQRDARRRPREPQQAPAQPTGPAKVNSGATVKELSAALGVPVPQIMKVLMGLGTMKTVTQSLTDDEIELIAGELEREVEIKHAHEEELEPETYEDAAEDLAPRPPVVTIMGHVDHGKTTLLDAIRESAVVETEAGGITQHIGAYQVRHDGRLVTFLDTPGHEAFTALRARGAKVTDIAVLVVAADDGVMPQTLEAIDHARAAKVPIVVAVNKVDKPDANPDRVKTELSEHGVVIEEYGGDVPPVPVSAKQGAGVEAVLDKGRGPVATVLVQTGTLRIGDTVIVGDTYGRVRALENSRGERVSKAGPASAVVLLGLGDVPGAGDILRAVPDEKTARAMIEERKAAATARPEGTGRATLEDLYRQIQAGQTKELRVIIKADVSGSLGAIRHALEQLDSDEVRINILLEGTGDVSDNDINLASASDAVVVGFNVKLDPTARRTAETDGVDVRLYDIIYRLTEEMDAALKGMLEPEEVEVVEGRAEVRQIFRVGKTAVIAGGYVTDGRIVRGGARVYRGGRVVATDRIESLRRFRDDVREVASGFECGIGLAGTTDLQEGDIIECFTTQTVSRVVQG